MSKGTKTVADCEFCLRLIAAVFLLISSVTTPFLFGKHSGNVNYQEDTGGAALLWTFLHYSPLFPVLAGTIEAIGGVLLAFNRTKLFGALLLLPLLFNLALFDIAYGVSAFATINTVAVLTVLILVFVQERGCLKSAVGKLWCDRPAPSRRSRWIRGGLVIVFLGACWFTVVFTSRAIEFVR